MPSVIPNDRKGGGISSDTEYLLHGLSDRDTTGCHTEFVEVRQEYISTALRAGSCHSGWSETECRNPDDTVSLLHGPAGRDSAGCHAEHVES